MRYIKTWVFRHADFNFPVSFIFLHELKDLIFKLQRQLFIDFDYKKSAVFKQNEFLMGINVFHNKLSYNLTVFT